MIAPRLRALAFATILLAGSRAAHAGDAAPITALAVGGSLDGSLIIYNAITLARKLAPGLGYGIAEIGLGAAQLVIGPILIAFADPDSRALWIGAGATVTVLAALVTAHGIWATATGGWGNAPSHHHVQAGAFPVGKNGVGVGVAGIF